LRTHHEGLGLGLQGLGVGLGTSGLGLGRAKAKTFPPAQDPGHVVAVHVCSAHTHGVTWHGSLPFLKIREN